MLTLLACGQSQNGTYVELMLQAYKLRVYAEAGVFEAEECLRASLKTLDGYQVDPDAQIVRDYATRVIADGGTVESFESTISSIKDLRNQDLYDKASLSLFPSGVKANKAYSILPTNGTGDFDVIRSTTKTRTNILGIIETVEANVPSLNYDIIGGTPNLLLEPQRTNLALFSSNKSNINAGDTQGTYSPNTSTLTPDNSLTSYRFTPTQLGQSTANATGASSNRIYFEISAANETYTNSIYVKSASGNNFNFAIKVVNRSSDTEISSKTIVVNNVWQRVEVSGLVNGSNQGIRFVMKSEQVVDLWGYQLEQGPYATSYIPTLGSAVTRNQDLVRKTAISDLIGQTEGVFQIETSIFESVVQGISLSDGTSNNRLIIFYWSGTNSLTMSVNSQSSNSLSAFYTGSDVKKIHKIAIRYKNNDFSLWVDGALVVQSNFVNDWSAPLSRIGFDSGFGTSNFNGQAKSVIIFKTYLSNNEMILLTTP